MLFLQNRDYKTFLHPPENLYFTKLFVFYKISFHILPLKKSLCDDYTFDIELYILTTSKKNKIKFEHQNKFITLLS